MICQGNRPTYQRRGLFLPAALGALLAASLAAEADEPAAQRDDKRSAVGDRQTILNSPAWKQTLGGLDEWFSTQMVYEPKQIANVKKQLMGRLTKMSADEINEFQQDLDAKLAMVFGPDGRDILGWVTASLAAAAPAYRKKMDLQYPDILKLTAAQLREQLDLLERRRSAAKNQSEALEHSRQARIASLQAEQHQQFQERERALDRGAATVSSPYHPNGMRQYPDVVSHPAYGWGFGFWYLADDSYYDEE